MTERQRRWCDRCGKKQAQYGACGPYCSACARLLGRLGVVTMAQDASTSPTPRPRRMARYYCEALARFVECEITWDGT